MISIWKRIKVLITFDQNFLIFIIFFIQKFIKWNICFFLDYFLFIYCKDNFFHSIFLFQIVFKYMVDVLQNFLSLLNLMCSIGHLKKFFIFKFNYNCCPISYIKEHFYITYNLNFYHRDFNSTFFKYTTMFNHIYLLTFQVISSLFQ